MLLIYLTTEHSAWVHHDKKEMKKNKKENDIILCNLMDKKKHLSFFVVGTAAVMVVLKSNKTYIGESKHYRKCYNNLAAKKRLKKLRYSYNVHQPG